MKLSEKNNLSFGCNRNEKGSQELPLRRDCSKDSRKILKILRDKFKALVNNLHFWLIPKGGFRKISNKYVGIFLVLVGSLQMLGDLFNVPAIKGIAAASLLAPAPKVFSSASGLETFSSQFFVEWKDKKGLYHTLKLGSHNYARLKGPYNRRNVYGALLSYGPILFSNLLTRPLFEAAVAYVSSGNSTLFEEIGIDPQDIDGKLVIRLEPRADTPTDHLPKKLTLKMPK